MKTDYSFGDSSRAALRLALLARVFEAPSRAFLEEAAPPGRDLALDLGCGPGFTTRLVADLLGCRRTVGLDASEAYIALAKRAGGTGLAYAVHDVSRVPLPAGPADLVYARLLASHLADPAGAIHAWSGALRPGGRLLLDEVEWIRSEGGAFRRYLGLVEGLLGARGQCLAIGPRLEGAAADAAGRVVSSAVRIHEVDSRDAATLFSLNLAELRQNGEVEAHLAAAALDDLAAELDGLRCVDGPEITWGLRQLALEV